MLEFFIFSSVCFQRRISENSHSRYKVTFSVAGQHFESPVQRDGLGICMYIVPVRAFRNCLLLRETFPVSLMKVQIHTTAHSIRRRIKDILSKFIYVVFSSTCNCCMPFVKQLQLYQYLLIAIFYF